MTEIIAINQCTDISKKKKCQEENACLPPLFSKEILTVLEFCLLLISI
jgi:hypothetical protein